MSDLAALPVKVQTPRLSSALNFVGTQSLYKASALLYMPVSLLAPVRLPVPHCCAVQTPRSCLRGRCFKVWWQSCLRARRYSSSAHQGELVLAKNAKFVFVERVEDESVIGCEQRCKHTCTFQGSAGGFAGAFGALVLQVKS